MAKNDIKMYIISRLTTLARNNDNKSKEEVELRSNEVRNMASQFGIRTKDIERELEKL